VRALHDENQIRFVDIFAGELAGAVAGAINPQAAHLGEGGVGHAQAVFSVDPARSHFDPPHAFLIKDVTHQHFRHGAAANIAGTDEIKRSYRHRIRSNSFLPTAPARMIVNG